MAAITSNLQSKEYTVQFTIDDLREENLKVTSCIRMDKIYTLTKYTVVGKFGNVKKEVRTRPRFKLMNY